MKVFFIYNPFTKHPKSVNETYFEHMKCAFKFFYTLLGLSIAALVHAIFPFLFVTTASRGVKKLNDCMKDRKPINGTEYHTFFPSNDFELPTHEEINKRRK
jgi:hypothetical protein